MFVHEVLSPWVPIYPQSQVGTTLIYHLLIYVHASLWHFIVLLIILAFDSISNLFWNCDNIPAILLTVLNQRPFSYTFVCREKNSNDTTTRALVQSAEEQIQCGQVTSAGPRLMRLTYSK